MKSNPNEVYHEDQMRYLWSLYHEKDLDDYPLQWDGARETSRGMHVGIESN